MAIEKWIVEPGQKRVIDIEVVRSLKVSLIGGSVNVIAHDEPGARVEVDGVSVRDLKIEIDGDRLTIDHPQLRWDNWLDSFKGYSGRARAEVSVLVPRDVDLKLGVVTAEALVAGFRTDAKLNSVSGDIVADHLIGDLEFNSVSGELSAGNHTGRISANTVSGDLTASGAVTKLRADSITGNVYLDAEATPYEIVTNTVSGAVTVRMPDGNGARYRFSTVSGSVHLDDQTFRGTLGRSFERVVGSIEGVWLDLQASSVSGDVTIVRRPAASAGASEAGDQADAGGWA